MSIEGRLKKGFTLLEVLVAGVLALLLLGLAVGYLFPSLRAAAKFRERSHLQQQAQVIVAKIQQAAQRTSPAGFSWSEEPQRVVAFNPAEDLQVLHGVVIWSQRYDLFWWDPDQRALKTEHWPPGTGILSGDEHLPVRAKRLEPLRLNQIVSDLEAAKVLSWEVRNFDIEQQGTEGELRLPVFLTLELGREVVQPGQESWQVLRQRFALQLVNQQ